MSSHSVLTAAHCVHDVDVDEFDVFLGMDWEGQESVRIQPLSVINHPKFCSDKDQACNHLDYDYSVITLTKAPDFSPKINPVCLPEPSQKFEADIVTTVSGWGQGGKWRHRLRRVN